jgi:hypothetical protein
MLNIKIDSYTNYKFGKQLQTEMGPVMVPDISDKGEHYTITFKAGGTLWRILLLKEPSGRLGTGEPYYLLKCSAQTIKLSKSDVAKLDRFCIAIRAVVDMQRDYTRTR